MMHKLGKIYRPVLVLIFNFYFFQLFAQQDVEFVPIVAQQYDNYNWYTQSVNLWGVRVQFPDEPEYKEKEIYTEKGLNTQKVYFWNDPEEKVYLELAYHPVSDYLNSKNEKKLIDGVAQKIAIQYGGYPIMGEGLTNLQGIREYILEIKTLKGQILKAKIFADGNQVMVASALISPNDNETLKQAQYFLNHVTFQPKPGEVKINKNLTDLQSFSAPKWDTLSIENFEISFPKFPISQHKTLDVNGKMLPYYEWYMGDGNSNSTYMLALTPLSNFTQKDTDKIIEQGINNTLNIANAKHWNSRSLDYFKYKSEELVFQTEKQFFRVRYFSDGYYLYQLIVSGDKNFIYQQDANRFLDGLKWTE